MAIIAMPTDRPPVPRRADRQKSILLGLERIVAERETLRRQEDELIDWARDEAVPWADIAAALGKSTEGCRMAYSKRRRARAAEAATCP